MMREAHHIMKKEVGTKSWLILRSGSDKVVSLFNLEGTRDEGARGGERDGPVAQLARAYD